MKILPIFALFLLFACCEETKHPVLCVCVEQFSDALPIQIWPEDCNTYNETDPEGVHYKCFCHPWKCADSIPFQFTNDEQGEYELVLYDENGDVIDSISFVESAANGSPEIPGITSSIALPALSTWLSQPENIGDIPWSLGSIPSINLPGAGFFNPAISEFLYVPYSFIPGYEYTITVNYTKVYNSGSSNPRQIQINIYNSSFSNIPIANSQVTPASPGGSGSLSITFTATNESETIAITATDGSDVDMTINSISGTQTTPVTPAIPTTKWSYYASFIPQDYSICEQNIRARIIKTSESPDQSIGKTDCLSISENDVDPTVLITYSNNRNFAGLIYENVSPSVEFNIRIPAVFFHERFPEEDEAIELSDSRIINLNGVVRAQRLLDTAHMTYYMHRKLKLIFKHNDVRVGDLAVTKQDAYEIEEGDRRWPLKKAKCWLTEKNFVQRNVV